MSEPNKQTKQLQFLYDWLQIARRPNQNLLKDIRMIFQLISIPVSQSEINILHQVIDPTKTKESLSRQDFLQCFFIDDDCKKPREKQFLKACKYVSGEKEAIHINKLKGYFDMEGVNSQEANVIIRQLGEYVDKNGTFDYKALAASLYY